MITIMYNWKFRMMRADARDASFSFAATLMQEQVRGCAMLCMRWQLLRPSAQPTLRCGCLGLATTTATTTEHNRIPVPDSSEESEH
jgi:hypothetical protein